jgi:hypothetical protein
MSPFVSQRLSSILNKEHYDAVRQLEAGRVRGQIVITP